MNLLLYYTEQNMKRGQQDQREKHRSFSDAADMNLYQMQLRIQGETWND